MFALFAALLLTLFMNQRHSDISLREPSLAAQNFVDSYTVEVKSKQFDESGRKTREMQADYAAHYSLTDESLLQSPSILSFSESNKQWRTSAENGKVRSGGHVFDLWTGVKIARLGSETVAQTDKLSFDSALGVANTESSVRIDSNLGVTTGTGMTANINQETVKLLSEVRSEFKPLR